VKLAVAFSATLHLSVIAWIFGVVRFSPPLTLPAETYTVSLVELPAPEPTPPPAAASTPAPPPREEIEEPPEPEPEPEITPAPPEPEPEEKPPPKPPREETHKAIKVPPEPPSASEPSEREVRERSLSGSIEVDAPDFPFHYYLSSIRRKIQARWRPIPPGGATDPQVVVVYFRIERNGTITAARVETASGHALYDRAGLRAVMESAPFPPLPAGFRDSELGVHFSFEYVP
jgi:protein TonB